jgi:hypothetical protein
MPMLRNRGGGRLRLEAARTKVDDAASIYILCICITLSCFYESTLHVTTYKFDITWLY